MNKEYIRHFREIMRIFDRELHYQNNASCCNGISVAQCHTLLEIEKNGTITVTDLANNLSLDKSTTSRTVEGLVNINLIDREIPKENRRMAMVSLTKNGENICKTINYTNDDYVKKILDNFPPNEQVEFLRLFKKMICNMASVRESGKCCN